MSESDFVDPNRLSYNPNIVKKYDFIYICLDEGAKHESTKCKPGWQSHNRNWELAKECLKVMCGNFKLRGLIMGRTNCDITEKCNNYISSMPFQPQDKFLELLQECKFIFVPNISDASPRVVTQAMCYNMPVLMNKNIIGGWKYVNNQTGVFFNDEKDITASLYELINNISSFTPRKWFSENYGKEKTGQRFLNFLKKHYTGMDFKDARYATFKRL
jgi:glycosyltransferase involved in cell wall biosynthesis